MELGIIPTNRFSIPFLDLLMFTNNSAFNQRAESVQKRISDACVATGRSPNSIKLMAVSKRFPLSAIEIAVQENFTLLGENRVQEAVEKIQNAQFSATWELIGHLQSNKAKQAVEHFDRIQSLDSLKLAKKLDHFAEILGKKQRVLIQVNTGADTGKNGFSTSEADAAIQELLSLKHLAIEGLMTIGPLPSTPESTRKAFSDLKTLRDKWQEKYQILLPELSMGMSGDLEIAIECGSTLLRVGTALFGERDYPA